MTAEQPHTEVLRCQIHNVDEPYTPGRNYKFCGECWHVWPTEADFRADVTTLFAEMNTPDWRSPGEPIWVVPDDVTTVYSCPLCAHDF